MKAILLKSLESQSASNKHKQKLLRIMFIANSLVPQATYDTYKSSKGVMKLLV